MMSLALHETVPGHHLQFIYRVGSAVPMYQKHLFYGPYHSTPFNFPYFTAQSEGWALYAEYLGEELGVYADDYELMGRYGSEMFRACRLVVDTGLHYLRWTRADAIQYLSDRIPMAPALIEIEVDRYLTWPGQACAYKIGELKIKELRQKAAKALGSKFDVRDFHALLLTNGRFSLTVMEAIVDDFIADNTDANTRPKNQESAGRERVVKMAGETATLSCAFPDLGPRVVVWRRAEDAQPLTVGMHTFTDDDRIRISHPDDAQWNLVITDVTVSDSGVYECQKTGSGSSRRLTVELVVEEPAGRERVMKMAGETATLSCAFPDLGPRVVVWRRAEDAQPLTVGLHTFSNDDRIRVSHQDDAQWNLVITDVTLSDSGVYECQKSGSDSSWRATMELVVESAPSFVEKEATVLKGRGADVTLSCQVTGNPLPVIHWIIPVGQRLPSETPVDERIFATVHMDAEVYTVTTQLHVHNLQSEDFGFYKCDAVNAIGSQRRYIKLTKGGR
ncbi:hypothetical protein ACOMHN_018770 [Nucella lapillus]